MRYFFQNNQKTSTETFIIIAELHPSFEKDGHEEVIFSIEKNGQKERLFVKKLFNEFFVSFDHCHWTRVGSSPPLIGDRIKIGEKLLYRGFIPSSSMDSSQGTLVTQMPGKVVKLLAKKGDIVKKGQVLMIIEAMKMENEVKADQSGEVMRVCVNEGETLDKGVLLIELSSPS